MLIRAALVTVWALYGVLSCKTVTKTTASVQATSDNTIAKDDLAVAYQALLSDPDSKPALDQIRAMSFGEYYDTIAGRASTDSVSVDGQAFPPPAADNGAARASFVSLHSAYPTVGEFWQAIGFQPERTVSADAVEALKMASDFEVGANGFDPKAYQPGEAPSQGAQGSLGLFDFGFFKHIYDCGSGMAHIREQLMRTSPICLVTCQSFWQSVAKCKEIMTSTKIIAEKIEGNAFLMKKFPFLNHPYYVAAFVRLGQITIHVAVVMDRLLGAVSRSNAYIRSIFRSSATPAADTSEPESNKDSRDHPTNTPVVDPNASVDAEGHDAGQMDRVNPPRAR